MYYEEKLIDGILHWRGTPDGEWQIIPAEKLGERVIAAEAFRAAAAAALAELGAEMADAAQNRDDFDAAVTSIDSGIDMLNATIVKLGLDAEVARYNQGGRK